MSESLYPKKPLPFRNNHDVLFVHFLYAHEGDCILLELPHGDGKYSNLLIDTGKGDGRLSGFATLQWFLTHFLPENNRQLQHALISHWHKDHYTNFNELLDGKLITNVIWVPHYLLNWFPVEIEEILKNDKKRMRLRFTWASKKAIFAKGRVKIEVIGPRPQYLMEKNSRKRYRTEDATLWPTWDDPKGAAGTRLFPLVPSTSDGTINNYSLVVKLSFCGKVALFPGDIKEEGWWNLAPGEPGSPAWVQAMRRVVQCDLLKVPHHGSTHVPLEIFQVFRRPPQYAVSTYKGGLCKYLESGRQIGSPWEELVCANADRDVNRIEEVFHIGGDEFPGRKLCTFAFVPNQAGTDAIIVPLIYKLGGKNDPFELYYFIRPTDRDSL